MSERGMLSRLAESLFWIGRYVERADDTARIVDSYVHRMVEDPFNDESATCRSLFSILGIDVETERLRTYETLQTIVYDVQNPNSIAGALNGAYENARRSRDYISSEMWVALNTTRNELPLREAQGRDFGPSRYLQYVRERTSLLAGLTDATLSHDDGWRFLVVGRNLERIDMTARLLRGRVVSDENAPDWMAFLRASGAMEAFMRNTREINDANGVAAFLMLDRLFPRSVLYSLNLADECLVEIQPAGQRISAGDAARQALARARGTLEFIDPRQLIEQLPDLLEMLETTCCRITDAVTDRFFRHDDAVAWSSEEGL
ncbi:MAG TPA: alpha-E domain-containing protein [Acidimicrobiales bacterium]